MRRATRAEQWDTLPEKESRLPLLIEPESAGKDARDRDVSPSSTGGAGGVVGLPLGSEIANSSTAGEEEATRRRGAWGHRRVYLRMHKFVFQWELIWHFCLCMLSVTPFAVGGSPWLAAAPLALWCFYNAMFVVGARRASHVLPGFDRFKRKLVSSMEEFLPPRLLPVLSLSFLSVLVAVTLTAARLGGPPLCFSSCSTCLQRWRNAVPAGMDEGESFPGLAVASASASASPPPPEALLVTGATRAAVAAAAALGGGVGLRNAEACGFANGKELLAFYTVSQSAILIYLAVMVGLLTCLAWKVSREELASRQAAESRLKSENPCAHDLREDIIRSFGRPGSSVRPETTPPWLAFGFVAACTFTLIGWRKWGDLPRTAASLVVIGVNVVTIFVSVLLLHVGFYGRLISLYQGNLGRVQSLSRLIREQAGRAEADEGGSLHAAQAWWAVRTFVLQDDLSLDYDIGGLGVSATFFTVLASFVVAISSIFREGLSAMLSPPGSYCAYASVYLTVCLIRIFGLATKTYREQQLHADLLQEYSKAIQGFSEPPAAALGGSGGGGDGGPGDSGDGRGGGEGGSAGSSSSAGGGDACGGGKGGGEGGGGGGGRAEEAGGAARVKELSGTREALAFMVAQVQSSDPYPCVLGIPVKPALFATSKGYVFVCFAVIGTKLLYDILNS